MRKIYSSATRIVLLLFALTICVGLFTGVVTEDTFKTAVLMVLSFYYSTKETRETVDTSME